MRSIILSIVLMIGGTYLAKKLGLMPEQEAPTTQSSSTLVQTSVVSAAPQTTQRVVKTSKATSTEATVSGKKIMLDEVYL